MLVTFGCGLKRYRALLAEKSIPFMVISTVTDPLALVGEIHSKLVEFLILAGTAVLPKRQELNAFPDRKCFPVILTSVPPLTDPVRGLSDDSTTFLLIFNALL